ncbi:hypothetical protein ACMFMG_004136 [Clarireedia jacksonii]
MYFKSVALLAGAAAILSPLVQAQTYTSCNPLNATCPNDPALGVNHTFYFNTSTTVTNYFDITAGSLTYGDKGAEFTINQEGQSPTIQSKFYIFFGKVSVIMQAAKGRGIVSSIVLESDDLDEVDWEFLGSNNTHAETNYFGKGNTTAYDRATWDPMSDPTSSFHNYTVDWTAERIEWWIDSVLVRTLHYADALGGKNFPQTPMTVRIGIWSGGDPKLNGKGTIEWAQGETDFSQVPFTMYVKEAWIWDYSTGKEYEWTDRSGDWQSIKVISGNSTIAKKIISDATPKETLGEKWDKLPKTTKLAVYCGAGAAAACVVSAFLFMFVRQRRNGRKERDAYNQLIEKQQQEANQDSMELRDKGMGGWDSSSSTKGEEGSGSWGGAHNHNDDTSYVGPNGSASSAMIQGGKGPQSPTLVETAPLSSPMSAEFNVQQPSRFGSSTNGGAYSKC